MPRTTRASGSSHAHLQNQFGIAQRDEPKTPPPEQSDAPKPSGQSSVVRQEKKKDSAHSRRLQKQLKEAKEALEKADAEEARKWTKQFKECSPRISLLGISLRIGMNKKDEYSEGIKGTQQKILECPQEKEMWENLLIKQYDRMITHLGKVISGFDESKMFNGEDLLDGVHILECINSDLESFDSLPDKDRLCAIDPGLKDLVDKIQAGLAKCRKEKAFASSSVVQFMMVRDFLKRARIVNNFNVLEVKMAERDYSDSMRSDVEKTIAEFDEGDKSFMKIIEKANEEIEVCDKLLADPHLHETLKNDVKKYRNLNSVTVSAISISVANNAEKKIHLLISLLMHDNSKQQGYEDLKEWHESIKSLMVECQSVVAVNTKLANEEADEYMDPDRLSQDELSVRLQAATEGPYQFEKILRTCERRAAEYDNLKQVVKDERLTPLLNEMAAKVADCMRNREYTAQMWSDKIRELERKRSAQASFLPSSSSQPVQGKIFHRTTEGVVVGSINQEGRLKGLDETGKPISTYFKDEDSGDWVRNYSDESEPAAPAQSTEPAAPQEKTTGRDKAERLVQKARNIEDASKKFAQKTHALVAASGDYDDKTKFLSKAISNKVEALIWMSVALVDLKAAQAEDPSGEDLSVILEEAKTRLLEDKRALRKQLNQTEKDGKLHFPKVGPPNGRDFKALQEKSQVASIVKEFDRRQNRKDSSDWLDRYVISFVEGPQNEQYDPWVVHAHYNAPGADVPPARVHMKYHAQKDWGKEMSPAPYHSPPLSEEIFNLVKQGVQPPLP